MSKATNEWAKDTPCKNITIYGYCKYENEGCIFNHDNSNLSVQRVTSSTNILENTLSTTKFNAKTAPSFTPLKSLNPEHGNSSSFTPERTLSQTSTTPVTLNSPSVTSNFNPYASDKFNPTIPTSINNNTIGSIANQPSCLSPFNPYNPPPSVSQQGTQSQVEINPKISLGNSHNFIVPSHSSVSNFPTIYPPSHSILQYHLYAPDPPPYLKVPLKPNERTPEMLFISNNLREQLVKKNLASLQVFPSGGNLPDIVGDYFGLVPLEFHNRQVNLNHYMNHQNSLYKVFSNFDGRVYIMRRIHDTKITEVFQVSKPFSNWSQVSCSNIIKIKDIFITRAFGDSSLCVVHEYYPQSNSLYETHFTNYSVATITQNLLWSYLVQLTNALQVAHEQNLSFNNLNWDKIIVTGEPGRIKVGDCGVYDVLHFDENRNIEDEQLRDYQDLGKVFLDLALKMIGLKDGNIDDLEIDLDFKNVVKYLLSDCEKSISVFTSLFSHKMLSIINSFQTCTEYMEQQLSTELENSRLFRIMCKLNFIFGRMESRMDINWSESGEKFPIILFYDYVFHQVDEHGKGVVDLAHILKCLNKLDAGVFEKIMLVTPDEMNCIIISYKELKDLVDFTFRSMTQ